MRILQLLKQKQENLTENKPITIAFIGDSVTQGCFECYLTSNNKVETVFDYKSAYSTRVREILNILYPKVQINIINSGISGDCAAIGKKRFQRDVLAYNPDLVVISYGLNDSTNGIKGLESYKNSLEEMFKALNENNIEGIFLTQNVMNTKTSEHFRDKVFIDLAEKFAKDIQNAGVLKEYFLAAKELCKEYSIEVCDLYSVWARLATEGVDTTELLANKLNHPIREWHYYMAIKLIETMLFS